MKVIGLTGSIGMGKSTIAKMFEREGVPVFDADAEVHRLQGPGGKALPAIEAAFPGVTRPDGLDRGALGQAVFGKPEELRKLERIMHPMVGAAQAAFLRRHRSAGTPFVILDIPLLFERGGWRRVDGIVTVSAPARVQRTRVLRRPGMTTEKFEAIRAAQTPDAEKRARSDWVIQTGLGKRPSLMMVRRLTACLNANGVRYCRQCVRSSSTRKRRVSTPNQATGFARSAPSS